MSANRLRFLIRVNSHYIGYFLYQNLAYIKRFLSFKKKPQKDDQYVYALHGSFIGMSKKFLESKILYLEKSPFLFAEELYLAERCREMGMKVKFLPSVRIEHNEHATTGLFKSVNTVALMQQALVLIEKTFYSKS
jgi:GT2 family glycosyltransferase